jgi:hypothetical protein
MKTKFTSKKHFYTKQRNKERKKERRGGNKEKNEENTFGLQRLTKPGCTQLIISTPSKVSHKPATDSSTLAQSSQKRITKSRVKIN